MDVKGRQGELGSTEAKTKYNWQLKTAALYQLELALINVGLKIVKIDPKYTSQTCASCGTVCKEARVSRSLYSCNTCGYKNHADVNAALNIRTRGIEKLKQEGLLAADFERVSDHQNLVLARNRSDKTEIGVITNTYLSRGVTKLDKKRKGRYRYRGEDSNLSQPTN